MTFTDLFFWALVSGQPQMVELMWSRVNDPLRCAVVGMEACRRILRAYIEVLTIYLLLCGPTILTC